MPIKVQTVDRDTSVAGKSHNAAALAAGASANADLAVEGYDTLVLLGSMDAAAAADLAVTVRAYDDAGAVFDVALPTEEVVAPALAGGVSRTVQRLRVRGYTKVQVRATNNGGVSHAATVVHLLD